MSTISSAKPWPASWNECETAVKTSPKTSSTERAKPARTRSSALRGKSSTVRSSYSRSQPDSDLLSEWRESRRETKMRLDDMISGTISRVIGRFVKRAVAGFFLVLFALAVIYQVTAAGTLALGEAYGMVTARLIVAGLFALAAGGAVAFLILTRAKPEAKPENILRQPRTLGIAMLLESVLLGYALSRGKTRSSLKRT